jgi:hypothetical protein
MVVVRSNETGLRLFRNNDHLSMMSSASGSWGLDSASAPRAKVRVVTSVLIFAPKFTNELADRNMTPESERPQPAPDNRRGPALKALA